MSELSVREEALRYALALYYGEAVPLVVVCGWPLVLSPEVRGAIQRLEVAVSRPEMDRPAVVLALEDLFTACGDDDFRRRYRAARGLL